jgi:aminotransferase
MELRKAIADKLKTQNGIDYKPEEVLVTVGLSEAVFCAMSAILNEGDEILVPNPGWLNYKNVPKLLGAVPIFYTLV